MKPWEQYQSVEQEQGPWTQYAEKAPATAPTASTETEPASQAKVDQPGMLSNIAAGAIKGASRIGDTLLTPVDALARKIGVQNSFIGRNDRGAAVDDFMRERADTDSIAYQGGDIAAQIAGTAGAGGVLAKGVQGISQAPRALQLAEALRTGGMSANGAGMVTRMVGGAVNGATQASMIDPSTAGTGLAIGAAMPPAMRAAGKVGGAVAGVLNGPAQTQSALSGIKAARDLGYVIPPSQAKPTLANRTAEGLAGKLTTAQNASAKNQAVTNRVVAESLGLPGNAPITVDALNALRKQAGQSYESVSSTGMIQPGSAYFQALDDIIAPAQKAAAGFPNAKANPLIDEIESLRSGQFDASSAVAKISDLRDQATKAYSSGDKQLGKALKSGANALEDAIETHLQSIGAPADLLQNFRGARQLIAKTYTAEKALNSTTGTVNAQKLATMLDRGKPLSGGMLSVAKFAQQFPKAAQPIEKMGSLPGTSPLDWIPAGALAAGTANPLMLAGVAARPIARAGLLSNVVQNGLSKPAGRGPISGLLSNPDLEQMLYLGASPAMASR